MGLSIAQTLDASSTEANNLIALANTFLATAFLEQGDLAEASALMEKVASFEYKPIIQRRVFRMAGNIAYKKKDYLEARRLYKSGSQISRQYEGSGEYVNLGNVYLAIGDLLQAETYFNKMLDSERFFNANGVTYAKYGLARVALAKGERDKAR